MRKHGLLVDGKTDRSRAIIFTDQCLELLELGPNQSPTELEAILTEGF